MQQYIEWLQTCLANINAGTDVQTYGQALYWQGMLLISLLVPIILIAMWILILIVIIKINLSKYKNIQPGKKVTIPKEILYNLSKTIKRIRIVILLYVAITLFFIMPIIIQSLVALCTIFLIAVAFVFIDFCVVLTGDYNITNKEYEDILDNKFITILGRYSLRFIEKNNPNILIPREPRHYYYY